MKPHSIKMVLLSPQIPPNTGSIARSCAALNSQLHLIKPLGFSISDKAVRRAGLDYWKDVDLVVHETFEDFQLFREKRPGRLIGFSPAAQVSFKDFAFQKDDWILHGREDCGVPSDVLEKCEQVLAIPMLNQNVRSLNLAVSAAISLFEAVLQVSG